MIVQTVSLQAIQEAMDWLTATFNRAEWRDFVTKMTHETEELYLAVQEDEDITGEMADMFICLFGAAAALGIPAVQLFKAIEFKMEANRNRVWRLKEDGTYQHV